MRDRQREREREQSLFELERKTDPLPLPPLSSDRSYIIPGRNSRFLIGKIFKKKKGAGIWCRVWGGGWVGLDWIGLGGVGWGAAGGGGIVILITAFIRPY